MGCLECTGEGEMSKEVLSMRTFSKQSLQKQLPGNPSTREGDKGSSLHELLVSRTCNSRQLAILSTGEGGKAAFCTDFKKTKPETVACWQ
jgi:hypothetical protein